MTDFEAELREAMRMTVADARPPEDLVELLRRRKRRSMAWLAASAAIAVVTGTAVATLALPGSPSRPALGSGAPLASPSVHDRPGLALPALPRGWVRQRDSAGDVLDVPATWHVSDRSALLEPVVRWVVSTGPDPGGGGCAPAAALRHLPSDGALFQVIEYGGSGGEPYTFPPLGDQLGVGPLGGPYECWGVRTHLQRFEDGGRYFQVQTVFGAKAPASLRAEVTRSLRTLRVVALPAGERPTARCQAGQWTYCQQADWAYEVLGRAHVLELGNQGTRALIGQAGGQVFALWTTSGAYRGYPCRTMAGATVCQAGRRLVLAVRGLSLWLAPARAGPAARPSKPGLPGDSVLRRLIRAARATPAL